MSKQRGFLSELEYFGITLVVLGILFGEDPLINYSFIGSGVLISITSAIYNHTKTRNLS